MCLCTSCPWDLVSQPGKSLTHLLTRRTHSDKAKKEYNDLVRNLAQFVRKRDPRVLQHAAKARQADLEKQAKRSAAAKQAAERTKQEFDDMEEEIARLDEYLADDLDKVDAKKEALYCIACNKKFKSDKAYVMYSRAAT